MMRLPADRDIPTTPSAHAVTLRGRVEHITFQNPDTHFTIARLLTDPEGHRVTILGHLLLSGRGETLEVSGHWERHSRYGTQLKVTHYRVLLPDTIDGIQRYLSSGVISGVGPKLVERLVRHFGAELLTVIETRPQELTRVRGVGPQTAARIEAGWKSHHAARQLMQFLQDNGLKPAYCGRILKALGEEAVTLLQEDPYSVVDELPGIGFVVADTVARNQGLPTEDPRRIRACIGYLLEQATAEGHVFLPETLLLERSRELFDITPDDLQIVTDAMMREHAIHISEEADDDGRRIYAMDLYEAERGLAKRLCAMMALPLPDTAIAPDVIEATVTQRLAIHPSPAQQAVLQGVLRHRLAVITGGPGTGKTTLIRSLYTIYHAQGLSVCLAAPTGRAARRLSEVTRRPAATLHKLLGYNPAAGAFEKDQDDPIDAEVFIVDEASMVDTLLMAQFLKAVPLTAILVLVGDVFQLPAVGPGNVLQDIIASRRPAVYQLQEIFRQDEESPIILNAHRVRDGRPPDLEAGRELDILAPFHFIETADTATVVRTIVDLCAHWIPDQYGFDPIDDIQVLTPVHKGDAGTINLNQLLQKRLNPNRTQNPTGFHPGDKVMHLRNNYSKEVFNGDIGRITEVAADRERLCVDFDGREVRYDFSDVSELTLAYAISVHKSQGSEYPAVVLPLLTQHYIMLQRNLLYTAITRGKMLVVIVGSRRALEIALQNDRPRQRLSHLRQRLASGGNPSGEGLPPNRHWGGEGRAV
jgi:exodeoxyribonuclease V alpha subunit